MINRRFLLNSFFLVLIVAGGAYAIISSNREDIVMEPAPLMQKMPVADSDIPAAPETVIRAVPSGVPVLVGIANFSYQPELLKISVGTKVIWKNEDAAKHNVLADNGEFSSRLLAKGETFEFIFNQKGLFAYHCGPHPWMKATVIVE